MAGKAESDPAGSKLWDVKGPARRRHQHALLYICPRRQGEKGTDHDVSHRGPLL